MQEFTSAAMTDLESFSVTTDLPSETGVKPQSQCREWGLVKKLVFRFLFTYFTVEILPFPFNMAEWGSPVAKPYYDLWNALVPWVGERVFHVAITITPNGSGDTTFNYVQVFCYFVIAVAVTLIWTILDRRRSNYRSLAAFLRVYVRYSLAATMITYGAVKVIKSQFPNPSLDRLIQPFGEASPMGLLWTFMGASQSYNVFTGAGEILGGLLLTTRRTTLLGALVCFGVMSHVAQLNFSYDVPVKLFSLHLLAMALYLIAPDADRLFRFFILNRAVAPQEITPLFDRPWVSRTGAVVRTLVVVGFLGMALWGADWGRKTYGDLSPRSPFYGIWNVETFELNGKVQPPLVTEASRWRRVVFDHPAMIAIGLMNDQRVRYSLELDQSAKKMKLSKRNEPTWKTTLSYQEPKPGTIAVEGELDNKKIKATLVRTNHADFLLLSRGFHWINEYPFNR